MPVSQVGKFIKIQNTFIKIENIIIIRPKEMIHYDHDDKILSKDFPEILVETTMGALPFLFQEFEQRDLALDKIMSIVAS